MSAEPSITFEAETEGPPRRKYWIWHEPPSLPVMPATNAPYGWSFAVDEYDADGEAQPFYDTWEMTFEEIVRYPELYGPKDMVWRNAATREVVDLYGLFP